MTFQRRLVVATLAAASLFVFVGCLSPIISANQRPDGIYHVRCRDKLQRCLDEVETLCRRYRYVVLRAFDDPEPSGVQYPTPGEQTAFLQEHTSEAFIRCGQKQPWGEDSPMKRLRADPLGDQAPAAAAPTPSPVCVPGASQACVGPNGCSGGEACLADGSGFGPCDCGTVR